MKRWLFFLLLISGNLLLLSQPKPVRDTAFVKARAFDANAVKAFKNSRDFEYTRSRQPRLSLWDRFWYWVWTKINRLLSAKGGQAAFWTVLITLAIGVILFFVVKATGMEKIGLFGRSAGNAKKDGLLQNDIHNISFTEAIEHAVDAGDFRMAVRLYYLQCLKKLSDKGYIDWRINKTNTAYLAEVAGKPFRDILHSLTFDFEYIWYGEKQLTKEQFSEIRKKFEQFNNQA